LAGDADDGLDEGLLLGCGESLACAEHVNGAVFLAAAADGARERRVSWGVVGGKAADGVKQRGLVGCQLHQQIVARAAGGLEGFFGSAWRRG